MEPGQKAGHKCAWHEGLVAFLWPRQEGRSLQGPMSTRCSPAEHSTASIPPKAMSGPARRALGADWGNSSGYGGRGCCFGGLLHPVPGSHPTPAAPQEARLIWGRLPPPIPWRCRGLRHSPRYTHHVAKAEVKAALFVHGVVQPRELGQRWPVVGEGVIPQAVIGAGRGHMGATGCLQQDWPSSPGGS